MNDSKKPVSMEDLRKALEHRPRFEFLKSTMYASDVISGVYADFIKEFERLFSVFQAESDKQVHVPRKRLSVTILKLERLLETAEINCGQKGSWTERVRTVVTETKQLLEASAEKETAKK